MTSDDADGEREAAATSASAWSTWSSVATAVAVYLLIESVMLAKRVPLGHDETVYLLRAREFANPGSEADLAFWAPYRAPGLPWILSVPMRIFGESVTLSRAVGVLFGAGLIVLTSVLVARLAGPTASAIAAWLMVMNSALVSYASLILLDVPGVFFSVVAVLLLERSTRRGVVSWWPSALVPLVCMGTVYVRFGTTTSLAAGLLAMVAARGPALARAEHRRTNAVRLAVLGLASAAAGASVLLVPWLTGSEVAPFELQRQRQVDKGLSPWSSYGNLADLFWPNDSRFGETFSWISLPVFATGIVLTAVAAIRGAQRSAAAAGLVAVVVWLIGLNFALAELFGYYLALGAPYLALAAAPGWAWLWLRTATTLPRRRAGMLIAALVAIAGSASSLTAAERQVAHQSVFEVYRSAGVQLNATSLDRSCGVVASYIQIAWYGDCLLTPFVVTVDPEGPGEFLTHVSPGLWADEVDADQVFIAVADRGKRQPRGDELEALLVGTEPVAFIDHPVRPITIYRAPITD